MERLTGTNILVTGGTGFVGSHLVEALVTLGARVVVPYRSLDPGSYFLRKRLERKVILVACDVKDFTRVREILPKYEIEYIFHLAAQAIVTTAYDNPLETFQSNVLGSVNVLESARLYGRVKGIIIASSDKAYGKSKSAYKETDPLKGDHPYEVSKSAEDLIASAYFKTYGLPIIITRFGNIYGEGDLNFNRIVPGIMKSIVTKTTLELRSDGTYTRDYVYVKDVVGAYVFLLRHLSKASGEVYNISSRDNYSVLDIVRLTGTLLHTRVRYSIKNTAHNEIPNQHLDYSKIINLGYRNAYTYRKVIKRVYAWYRAKR